MVMTVRVDIVSAEKSIFSGQAEMVIAPASQGDVGITPRHAPLLTPLRPGTVRVLASDNAPEQNIFISGGILEVQPHLVSILADTAVRAADLDEAAALEAKTRAEEALKDRSGKIDYARAHAELLVAIEQLRTIEKLRRSHTR